MIAVYSQSMAPFEGQLQVEKSKSEEGDPMGLDSINVRAAEDCELVARVRNGEEEAARELVRDLYPTIIRLVRGHLPRRMSEEDLAQTVYMKVFTKLHQFSGRVPLKHWVSRIAVNTCFNALRSERSRSELRMSDLSEEQSAVIQQLTFSNEELPGGQSQSARELIHAILERLKPEERLVINLLHLEEWSVDAISQRTGWSVSRVKVKAFRARQKMRKLLNSLLADHQEEDTSFVWSGSCTPEVGAPA